MAPFLFRYIPQLKCFSPHEINLPNPTTGCGSHVGSPRHLSSIQAITSDSIRYKLSIVLELLQVDRFLQEFELLYERNVHRVLRS